MTPRRIGSLVLTVTALLGTLCIVATVAAVVLDVKPLVFRSGSMSPDIRTGALALARTTDARDIDVGDVVSVVNAQGSRVTHRVVTTTVRGDTATLVLKGDANASADPEPYVVTSVERVLLDVPRLGYVVSWVTGPAGMFLGGLVVGAALLMLAGSAVRRDAGGARRATAVLAVLALGAGATSTVGPQKTLAAFTDTATVTSGTLRSYLIPRPQLTVTSCVVTGTLAGQKTATVTFPALTTPFAFTYAATIVETGQSVPVTGSGANRQVQFSAGLLSTILNQTYTIRITARIPGVTSWTSVGANQPVTVTLLGLGMSCGTPS